MVCKSWQAARPCQPVMSPRRPAAPPCCSGVGATAVSLGTPSGRRTVNTEPLAGSLATVMPGRTRTCNQTVMSGPVSPKSSNKIDVFRRVRARSFASVHGVSMVYLWSVRHFPRPLVKSGGSMMRQARPREYRQAPGNRPMKANAIAEPVRALLDPRDAAAPSGSCHCFWLGQWSYAIVWSKLPSQKSDGFPKELAINSIESPNRESD